MAKFFVDGEDAMSMSAVNKLKRHDSRPIYRVFGSAGRTKFGVATERYKLEITTVGASIHGTAKRWVTTINHLRNVFHNNRTRMK